MHLKIKKHVESAILHLLHNTGAISIKQRHANLDPSGMVREKIGKLKSSRAITVKSHDKRIARLGIT